jgi:hypothetical protein
MFFRNTVCLSGAVFLFTAVLATGTPAESQTPQKSSSIKSTASANKWADVKGFRSARFGMNEKSVLKTIAKDFKIPRNKVKRNTHPEEKTVSLEVEVPEVLSEGGKAVVGYVFGYNSKTLIQVNVVWGKPVESNPDARNIVNNANRLRSHFIKKKYQKDGYVTNAKMDESRIIVFRGKDQEGRMVLMILTDPEKNEKKGFFRDITLRLSYILQPDSPDILTIKEGDF